MLSIFLIKCYLIHCADPFCWYGVWSYLHFTIHSGSALFLFDFQRKCSYFSCAKLEVLSLFLPYTAPAAAPAVAAIKIADNEFLEKEHHMSSVMYGVSPYTTVFCLCFRSWSRDLSERVFVCPAVEAAGVFLLRFLFAADLDSLPGRNTRSTNCIFVPRVYFALKHRGFKKILQGKRNTAPQDCWIKQSLKNKTSPCFYL